MFLVNKLHILVTSLFHHTHNILFNDVISNSNTHIQHHLLEPNLWEATRTHIHFHSASNKMNAYPNIFSPHTTFLIASPPNANTFASICGPLKERAFKPAVRIPMEIGWYGSGFFKLSTQRTRPHHPCRGQHPNLRTIWYKTISSSNSGTGKRHRTFDINSSWLVTH